MFKARLNDRGYFGIGIENNKFESNIGTLWRSALSFDADFIFTIGKRYKHQSTDTTQSWRHVPLLNYENVEEFKKHLPFDCKIVGVEIAQDAKALETFKHPTRAVYILGPEDGSLSKEITNICDFIVQFSTRYCVNVSVAGSIVMYDRTRKRII